MEHASQVPAVVGGHAGSLALPVLLADFGALARPGVQLWPVALLLVGNAAILGIMVFINTAMSAQAMSQFDRVSGGARKDGVVAGLGMMVTGASGAAAISGSILTCLAMARTSPLRWQSMVLMAAVVAGVYLTGVPLIGSVTGLAVLTNMVVAAFAGLVLGLFLFAVRSGRRPVRQVWTGRQLSSNCARGSSEMRVLAMHADEIRVFELEGDMFFAVGASLDRSLHLGIEGGTCVVLDWSHVRHIDSSVAGTVARFELQAAERGLFIVHACPAGETHGNVSAELRRRMPGAGSPPTWTTRWSWRITS